MINLVRLFLLTLKRKNSVENYLTFQEYQAEYIIKELVHSFTLDRSMTIIDYGCGIGGYTKFLAQYFKHVVAVDYHVKPLACNYDNIEYVEADLLSYRTNPADIVFCSSVIEHINTSFRGEFIRTIAENLKPSGYLYLSFPPFNSPIGGHKSAPFHYFPDQVAFRLASKFKNYTIDSYETMWGSWGLYKTCIGEVKRILLDNGFMILAVNSRYMPRWYSRLFGSNDYMNWNAEFYCIKQ